MKNGDYGVWWVKITRHMIKIDLGILWKCRFDTDVVQRSIPAPHIHSEAISIKSHRLFLPMRQHMHTHLWQFIKSNRLKSVRLGLSFIKNTLIEDVIKLLSSFTQCLLFESKLFYLFSFRLGFGI